MITSVESGPCGPCCSVDPVGTSTVSPPPSRYASTWGRVSSARNTDGRGIRFSLAVHGGGAARDEVPGLARREPRHLDAAALDRARAAGDEAALRRDVDRA